jgi:hypothetical protein
MTSYYSHAAEDPEHLLAASEQVNAFMAREQPKAPDINGQDEKGAPP